MPAALKPLELGAGKGCLRARRLSGEAEPVNLIPVAVGRCNGQIMPVIGNYVGATEDFAALEVMVQVLSA